MDVNLPPLSFRQLKVISIITDQGNFASASMILGRSKSSISKTVKEVERALGCTVFENDNGVQKPTAQLRPLFDRARGIIAIFNDLAAVYQQSHSRARNVNALPLFTMDLSTTRMRKLALLDKTQSIEETAAACGNSVSAVYKFFHELEEQLDTTLFARLPDGRYIPINFGEYLCRRVRLALSELRLAFDEVRSINGTEALRIVIGCLPSMRPAVLPSAITKMNDLGQNWAIRIETGTYTQMASDMLRGEVDLIIGGTPLVSQSEELATSTLTNDWICILSRSDHPFLQEPELRPDQLSDAQWVLPLAGTPSRHKFDDCLANSGITVTRTIEAGDPTALRGIMLSSDVVSIGTYFQSQFERDHGHLAVIPFDLVDADWPIGYTMRKSTEPSTALRKFIQCLIAAIDEIEACAW